MPGAIRHEALRYGGANGFVPACVSLIEDGLAADQRLLLLSSGARLAAVRDAMGRPGDEITYVATDDGGANPYRITSVLDGFRSAADGRRSVGLTDWTLPGRSTAALAEAQLAESLLNIVAVQSWPLDVVCLYDAEALADAGLADLRRAHPVVRGDAVNPAYDPALAATLFAAALPAAPADARTMTVTSPTLGRARRLVAEFATDHGLTSQQVEDLVLAANEIATNSVRYGGGSGRLTLWAADGAVVCETSDAGHLVDALAGRLAPPPDAVGGRGLWIANQLCDLVQIRSSPAGTVVRLFMNRL
jgi:anti-sigma regulatory factor (Ser/Thr protein kinase)